MGSSSQRPRAVSSKPIAWLAALLGACASATPDPDRLADELPPELPIDAAARTRADAGAADATAAIGAGDFAAARAFAERALRDDPRQARARAALGRCLMEEARGEDPPSLRPWHQAEGELRRAERLATGDVVAALWHAEFLTADGHRRAAIDRLRRTDAVAPGDVDLARALAWLHYEVGDEGEAASWLSRVVADRPQDAPAWYRLAQCRARRAASLLDRAERVSESQAAVDAFARFTELQPDDADGWRGLGQARFAVLRERQVPFDDAALAPLLAALDRASALAERSPDAEFDRGCVLDAAGRIEDAIAAYERALARDPRHVPSRLNLTADLADVGRVDAACALAIALLEPDSGVSSDERRRLQAFVLAHRGR